MIPDNSGQTRYASYTPSPADLSRPQQHTVSAGACVIECTCRNQLHCDLLIRDIAIVEVLLHAGADVNGANPKVCCFHTWKGRAMLTSTTGQGWLDCTSAINTQSVALVLSSPRRAHDLQLVCYKPKVHNGSILSGCQGFPSSSKGRKRSCLQRATHQGNAGRCQGC